MNGVEGTTMIGKSVKIVGDLSGSEDLMMDGEFQGSIRLAGARLTIGPAARVRGDVAAKDVIVLGSLDGDIRATGRVELRSSAIVMGNIYAGTFSIQENAAFRGQIDPSRAHETPPEKPSQTVQLPQPVQAAQPVQPVQPTRHLPAALAAVAASRSVTADPQGAESTDQSAPLFAETKA